MKPYEVILLTVLMFIATTIQRTNTRTRPIEFPRGKPSIYITRTDHIRPVYDGSEMWIIEYTVDGAFQSAAFDSPEEMGRFIEYLDTVGNVYRREAGDPRE
jgi:hypothetical protein